MNLIYYIDGQNRLIWNRHVGRDDGSFQWAEPENREVGTGWDVKHVFSGGDGLIYGSVAKFAGGGVLSTRG
jgi:N,N-dimethylformamidase